MRIEKHNERELARRKGLTRRTVAQAVWFLVSGAAAYFGVRFLFTNEVLSHHFFYFELGVPAWVPEWAITGLLVLIGVGIMQFFFVFGYTLASPEGRQRSGRPTPYTRNPDPLENDYSR